MTLGNTALQSLMPDALIGNLHGQPQSVMLSKQTFTLFPLYHPAAVIYNRALQQVYHDDLQLLKNWLDTH